MRNNRTIRRGFGSLCGVLASCPLILTLTLAQAGAEPPVSMDVLVTDTPLQHDLPVGAVTRIDRDMLEQTTARTVADMIQQAVPSAQVTDMSGNGSGSTVDLRGFGETGGQNTVVVVDGRRVTLADSSGTDLAPWSLDQVEHMEILRGGAGAVLYGDNASGGVIRITTRHGMVPDAAGSGAAGETADYLRSAFSAHGGSHATRGGTVRLTGRQSTLGYGMNIRHDDVHGERENSDSRSNDVDLVLHHATTDRLAMRYAFGVHENRRGFPGSLRERDFAAGLSRRASRFPDDVATTSDRYLHVTPEWRLGPESRLFVPVVLRDREYGFDMSGWTEQRQWRTLSLGPQWINGARQIGLVYQSDQGDIRNGMGDSALERTDWAGYLYDAWQIADAWRLTAGYRHQHAVIQPGTGRADLHHDVDAWHLGLGYTLPTTEFYLAMARSFRLPSLDEWAWAQGLRDQQTDEYSAGVHHQLNRNTQLQLDLYWSATRRELVFDPNLGLFGANTNLPGTVRREGVDVRLLYTWSPALTLRGGVGYLDAQFQDGPYAGAQLPGVSAWQLNSSVIWQPTGTWTWTSSGAYAGARPLISDFANQSAQQPGYWRFDTRLDWPWPRFAGSTATAAWFVAVQNLTDVRYDAFAVYSGAERAVYPAPGRQLFAGIRVELP